jgi:hypothetical protein
MNIFGIEIQFSNSNGKYIKRKECHTAMDCVTNKMEQVRLEVKEDIGGIHKRIDELFTILLEKK